MNRSRELTKNTLIITIGRLSTQFISFFLLPLYTTLLSNEEYGTVDFITTLVQLLVPVVSLMIDQSVFRLLLNCEGDEAKKKTISSAILLLSFSNILVTVVFFVVQAFISNKIYMLWLLLILIATSYSNLFLQISRGLKQTLDYAIGSSICSMSTIVLNVVCIATLHMHAVGMLIATLAGNVLCCVYLFFKLKIARFIDLSAFDKVVLKDALKYSLPLVPNQLSLWIMNSSDRMIVVFFMGAATNGILAVTHKLASVFLILFNIFQLAWHETGIIHYSDEDRDSFFSDMVNRLVSVFATTAMSIILGLSIFFDQLVKPAFAEAYFNIPIYLIAYLFNVVIGLLGVVYVATKRTNEIAKTTIFAAAINIVVNCALIRYVGLYAASISSFIGYFVTMVYRIIDSRKYLTIQYNGKRILSMTVMIIVCCIVYYMRNKIISFILLPLGIAMAYLLNRRVVDSAIVFFEKKTGLSRRIIVTILVCAIVVMLAATGLYVYRNSNWPGMAAQPYKEEVDAVLTPERVVLFSDFNESDFTCTGMTYDSKEEVYWLADNGALASGERSVPKIVKTDGEFCSSMKTIELGNVLDDGDNLQGIAYDSKDDSLWLAVGKELVEIDKNGNCVKKLNMGKYIKCGSNGICYDERDDSLWVLCAVKYLLHYAKDGSILNEFPFYYEAQDHICTDGEYIYATVGADYQGSDNFVYQIRMDDASVIAAYRTEGSNSLEGICIKNNRLLIANDGRFHSDLVGHSYLTIYSTDMLIVDS